MKKLAMWSLILAVAVLAVGTAAQAAVVNITLTFDKTTGIAIGEEVGWQMTVQVTGNSYTATIGGTQHTYNAGFQSMAIGIGSTAAVGAFPTEPGSDPATPAWGLYNVGTAPDGWPDPSSGLGFTVQYGPNGGITDQLLAGAIKSGGYNSGNFTTGQADLKPAYKIGVTEVIYASGIWTATADGTTGLTPFVLSPLGRTDIYNPLVYTVSSVGAISQRSLSTNPATDQVNFNGVTLTVGAGPTNTAPTVSIPGGDVGEADWSKEPGWNNPLHSVMITADGQDDGKPVPPGALTYEWTMSKPGGGSKLLAETGKVLTLTIAEIASLGLPGPYNTPPGPDPDVYMWDLSVRAYDGALYSPLDGIKVFVPEPATMGLLAFGVVGALLRRRRRA